MNFQNEILPILVSFLGILSLILVRKNIRQNTYLFSLWVSGIVFFAVYAFLILATVALDASYWAEYNSLDKNDAGYVEAQTKVVNDTARNLVFITGIFISMLVSFTVFLVGSIGTYIKVKRNKIKNCTQQRL